MATTETLILRFDAEMRRMEDEMQNFRQQLIQRQENFFRGSSRWLKNLILINN